MTTLKLTHAEMNLLLDALEDSATASERRAVEARRVGHDVSEAMATARAREKRELVATLLVARDKGRANENGLTYLEWIAAATLGRYTHPGVNASQLYTAWCDGEDPTEYAATLGE